MTKRLIAAILAVVMLFAFAGCQNNDDKPATTPTTEVTQPTTEATEDTEPSETTEPEDSEPTDPSEPTDASETVQKLDDLAKSISLGFGAAVTPVDHTNTDVLASYTGLTDNTGILEAAAWEPMIGSQAFSVVLLKVDSSVDKAQMEQNIKDNVNPRKWICVEADQMASGNVGEYVIFAMMSSELSGEYNAQSIVDTFLENNKPAG